MTNLSYFKQYTQAKPLTARGQRILRVLLQDKKPDEKNKTFRQLPMMDRHKVSDMWYMMHTISTPDEVINASELQCGYDIE